jgi:hypothetical protein
MARKEKEKKKLKKQTKLFVTLTWAAEVQNVVFLTITGDKFVIYVPIRKYGDFNTLQ